MNSPPTRSPRRSIPSSPRRAEAPTPSRETAGATGSGLLHVASFKLALLDFIIGLGRKVAAFCALLTLGWTYFRLLFLGHSLHQLYPDAPDPELRQTLWVALLLIMAQGWDISTDQLEAYWIRLRAHLPRRPSSQAERPPLRLPGVLVAPRQAIEPIIVHLGRFMDLCVAIANKVGAFAVLVYLIVLGVQVSSGATIRQMYPSAADPTVSLLADLAVYVVVLGWWAMPFEQIVVFWRRLRGRDEEDLRR